VNVGKEIRGGTVDRNSTYVEDLWWNRNRHMKESKRIKRFSTESVRKAAVLQCLQGGRNTESKKKRQKNQTTNPRVVLLIPDRDWERGGGRGENHGLDRRFSANRNFLYLRGGGRSSRW